MPQNITDVDAFTDPIVVPADADSADLTYILTFAQGVANRTRMLLNRLDAVIPRSGGNTDEFLYPSAKTRTILVPLADAGRTSTAGSDDWVRPSSLATNSYWSSNGPNLPLVFPLNGHLPHGAVIQTVKVCLDPDTAQAILTDRMLVELQYATPAFTGAPPVVPGIASVALAYDDGTANRQVVTVTPGGGHTVVKEGASAREYTLIVYSGDSAGGDFVHGVQITFTDPGPRNY